MESSWGAVVHCGDNLSCEGDGVDEVIKVNISRLPANV
ncbi:TerD family protein [Klebsiella quasipneumoniae]|nr:TerD family protein [Klebsiella quasipneumoniae]